MKQNVITLVIAAMALLYLPSAYTAETQKKPFEVLFIGNSYTARHNLSQVVKAMAEAGNPGLTMNVSTIIYGGRTLADHWRLGTQNFVSLATLTEKEEKSTISSLEKIIKDDPEDKYAKSALSRHRKLFSELDTSRKKWDVVVLQSYRDDLEGDTSLYAQYAPKFAEIIKAQNARIILYETSPTTQNANPIKAKPDPAPVHKKANGIAALADRLGAKVAPMSLVALRCQTERPDFTLRFINDAHLNHTMAYLTACTIYSALFDKSPVGLSINSITDIRFLDNNPNNRDKDRDGNPIKRTFSKKDSEQLQSIAWKSYNEFKKLSQK